MQKHDQIKENVNQLLRPQILGHKTLLLNGKKEVEPYFLKISLMLLTQLLEFFYTSANNLIYASVQQCIRENMILFDWVCCLQCPNLKALPTHTKQA